METGAGMEINEEEVVERRETVGSMAWPTVTAWKAASLRTITCEVYGEHIYP